MRIDPHHTGHVVAQDGRLLRVDLSGRRWVATRYNPDLSVHDQVYGTDEQVHEVVERWRIRAT
jgi:hypothetical protein